MMTPTTKLSAQQKLHRRFTTTLSLWQRLLLGSYSLLLALVLPLICWGAAAEPGHPHRFPHFVFAEPRGLAEPRDPLFTHAVMGNMGAASAHQWDEHEAAARGAPEPATCSLHGMGTIAGRATPTLMVFFILLLLFLGEWTLRRLDGLRVAFRRHLHFPATIFLPVPLPPPRLLLPASWQIA